MAHDEDFQRWIKEIMSKIIENLGPNIDEARYEILKSHDFVMSAMHYACVKYKNRLTGQSEELSMILKKPTTIEATRTVAHTDNQFHNEIIFYQIYAQPDENFPKLIYAVERPPIDSVIALENVTKWGYNPCPHAYYAPLEFILTAVREIGRFHGKGYVMKNFHQEKFFNIVEQLKECRYNQFEISKFINAAVLRSVKYLRSLDYDTVFCDKMESLFSNVIDKVMLKVVKPLEPLSMLCHGDFTLSNVLFKTEDDGQHKAMLIDFALLRYGTPVVDLSTFLCLACSNEVRKNNFFDIMRAYHDSMIEFLLDAGMRDIEEYSYDTILDDFRRGGLFGFAIASFYLPMLMGYFKGNYFEMELEDSIKKIEQCGGNKMNKILADMLLHLKDLGCLKQYL